MQGTDFVCTIDITGKALIILLPNEFGDASGEIVVQTAMGQQVLNKPFQATTTSAYDVAPTKPVTLDIDLNFIDNMLIVSPPKEQLVESEETQTEQADYLEFTDLDIDFLSDDDIWDEEDNIDFSELDIDLLNVNLLEDLLDVLDELDVKDEDNLADFSSGIQLVGTNFGQDVETQVTTIIQGSQIKFMRMVNQRAQVLVNSDQAYNIIFTQDGVSKVIQVNGTADSTINITQSSG